MGRTVTAYLSKAEHSPPLDITPAGSPGTLLLIHYVYLSLS